MRVSMLNFIQTQWMAVPPVVKADLVGKTIIVTGTNVGIGLETAKHIARMGPGKFIVTCRNEEKAQIAASDIRKETGCETVEPWVLDLADFFSVKDFADRFNAKCDRLDILIENAGIAPTNVEFTRDGWESSTQVNDLSTSLLALLLLPKMLDTAQKHSTTPRIVVVSSQAHYRAVLSPNLINSPNFFRNYAHKDFLKSSIGNRYGETKCLRAWSSSILELLLARTAEEGSRQSIWGALAKEEDKDNLRGAYISLAQVLEPSDFVVSEEGRSAQNKLWDDLVAELTKVEPRVQNIVEEYLTKPVTE